NITMLERSKPGQHIEPEQFKEKMLASPGWQPGEVIEAAELKGRADRYLYRLAVNGAIDGKQIIQTFYLVANSNGEQAVVAFQFADNVRGCAMGKYCSAGRWWQLKRKIRSVRHLSFERCRLEDRTTPSTGVPAIVADINTLGAGSSPSQFVDVNGTLFFAAND